MSATKTPNVRARIYSIILVIMIPMLLVAAYSVLVQYNFVIESEMNENHRFAEKVGSVFENHMEGLSESLYLVGGSIVNFSAAHKDEIKAFLQINVNHNPAVERLSWVEPSGHIVACSVGLPVDTNVQNRDYYNRILLGENIVVNDVIVSLVTSKPAFLVAQGIRDGMQLLGIIVAAVNLEFLDQIMPAPRVDSTNSFGLVDSKGVIAYREGSPGVISKGELFSEDENVIRALRSGQSVGERRLLSNLTNSALVSAAVPIRGIGWVAFAHTDARYVIGKAFSSIKFSLGALLIATLVSLVLAVNLGNSISHPMDSLKTFADELSNGNTQARIVVKGTDEIGATGEALNHMAMRIEQLEDARRLFIQSTAHELRNPMTGIKGILSVIRRSMARGKSLADVEHLVQGAEREVDRLSGILDQLLTAFNSLRSGENSLTYNFQAVNLRELLETVTANFQMANEDMAINLDMGTEDDAIVWGDRKRLEDVLRNVLSNATKYSPNERDISVSLRVADNKAIVSIRDKGVGIPKEQLDRVFESFVRIENFDGEDPGGMGLGLYISRNIIRKHHGRIWAENHSDKGSIFFIEIQLLPEGAEL